MNKNILRKNYLKIRKEISELDRAKYNDDIFTKVINLKEYKESKLILTYVSLEDEVDTIKLIEYSLNIGKNVAAPKCKDSNIVFYNINILEDLEKGSYGILEPKTNEIVTDFSDSICIIPGVTFDIYNNRIGYGKGFYDKFLKKYNGIKIGLCYNKCICERIDSEINDIKMNIIITN